MAIGSVLLEILNRPNTVDLLRELMLFVAPLWVAVFVGVVVGWTWKPKWANEFFDSGCTVTTTTKKGSSLFSVSVSGLKNQLPNSLSWVFSSSSDEIEIGGLTSGCSSTQQIEMEKSSLVTKHDLEVLYKLVQEKDGGPDWIQMMDRSNSNMSYQAWRRDPETGPPQYRTRTVFEDATPEMVRDFFWDDEFRPKWDDMLVHTSTLEECPRTGTMVVQWVRKFPFFCSDREYIIGRRIWESGRTYYCVTKDVPFSSVLRRNKPRRVDLFYSSWCIRAVESNKGDGQLTACEVLLFHHEDMGIPWEIAKLGVRQGMWGAVKKIEPGLRAYEQQRASGLPISRCAFMSQINTKVSLDYLRSLDEGTSATDSLEVETPNSHEKQPGRNIPRLLVVGGAVALACTIDRGLLTKALIFGVARTFANIGKKL